MSSRKLTRFVAAGAAAAAVAAGGITIANSSSSNGASASAQVAQVAGRAHVPRAGGAPLSGQAPSSGQAPKSSQTVTSGRLPQGWTPRSGTIITGAGAEKASAVALAKYPGRTVNRVMQLSDGTYAVHLFGSTTGPHHVFVNKQFKITSTA